MVNLDLSFIAKIDFICGATKSAFWDRIKKKIFMFVELNRDHINIENLQTV